MFKISLPEEVSKIINELQKGGFEAFVVGGCVRDSLMNALNLSSLAPNDWDITTSAKPDEVMKILKKAGIMSVPTGIKHGTISAIIQKQKYEITTYRTEGKYLNHRTPLEVEFSTSLEDDICRRDFKINAMAYHPDVGIVDIYGGILDLQNKVISAVGDPNERFEEDALRILRALRFAARFGFEISEQTSRAIFTHKELLKFISIERIVQEIRGIVCGDFAFDVLREYQEVILFAIFQDSLAMQNATYQNAIKILSHCPKNPITRLIALFYFGFMDRANMQKDLQRLKLPKWTQNAMIDMMGYLPNPIADEKIWIKQSLSVMGEKNFRVFLDIKHAEATTFKNPAEIKRLQNISQKLEKMIEDKEPIHIKDLAINGDDLQQLGIPKGKKIKEMLHKLLQAIMHEKIANNKESLRDFVLENKKS